MEGWTFELGWESHVDPGHAVGHSSACPHCSLVFLVGQWKLLSIDGRRRDFLWAGAESVSGSKCKVTQQVVCRPKELERLGITDLHRFGMATPVPGVASVVRQDAGLVFRINQRKQSKHCYLLQWRSKWVMCCPFLLIG
jgi:hypothetical protein